MSEKEHISSAESGEMEFFDLGPIGLGGLPADLGNDAVAVDMVLFSFLKREDTHSEEELRSILKTVRTFEEYFKGQAEAHNCARMKEGKQLYDVADSLKIERGRINPELIDEFNEKVSKLHEFADREKIDKKAIRRIIHEEILPLIIGKKRST